MITGGAGFIGSHLAEELSLQNIEVIVYDDLSTGKLENIKGIKHQFVEGDILDYKKLLNAMKGCEYVFHLAAATSVVESIENPEKYIDINTKGTLNVLRAAKSSSIKKVIFASSGAIYGDSEILPKTEKMIPEPKSPYAVTKLDGEYYCKIYMENYELPTVITRFFNVFGEKQDPMSKYAAVIPIFLDKIKKNEQISIYGDGEQTRDFIYVKDVINALIFLAKKATGVYNIGYGKTISINSLISRLSDIMNIKIDKKNVAERNGEIKHSYASIEKLSKLGFKAKYSFDEGLEKIVSFIE